MWKLTVYTAVYLVVLCILPLHCELREVDRKQTPAVSDELTDDVEFPDTVNNHYTRTKLQKRSKSFNDERKLVETIKGEGAKEENIRYTRNNPQNGRDPLKEGSDEVRAYNGEEVEEEHIRYTRNNPQKRRDKLPKSEKPVRIEDSENIDEEITGRYTRENPQKRRDPLNEFADHVRADNGEDKNIRYTQHDLQKRRYQLLQDNEPVSADNDKTAEEEFFVSYKQNNPPTQRQSFNEGETRAKLDDGEVEERENTRYSQSGSESLNHYREPVRREDVNTDVLRSYNKGIVDQIAPDLQSKAGDEHSQTVVFNRKYKKMEKQASKLKTKLKAAAGESSVLKSETSENPDTFNPLNNMENKKNLSTSTLKLENSNIPNKARGNSKILHSNESRLSSDNSTAAIMSTSYDFDQQSNNKYSNNKGKNELQDKKESRTLSNTKRKEDNKIKENDKNLQLPKNTSFHGYLDIVYGNKKGGKKTIDLSSGQIHKEGGEISVPVLEKGKHRIGIIKTPKELHLNLFIDKGQENKITNRLSPLQLQSSKELGAEKMVSKGSDEEDLAPIMTGPRRISCCEYEKSKGIKNPNFKCK